VRAAVQPALAAGQRQGRRGRLAPDCDQAQHTNARQIAGQVFHYRDRVRVSPVQVLQDDDAGSTLLSTLPRLIGSVTGIIHEMGANGRREKKRRRVEETRDYGALVSVRELAADTKWQRYFQIFDDERFVKVIEQRIFRSLVDFLKEHNVDTSSLESRAEMLINNGTIFGDNANIKDSQVGGAGTRLSGFIPRMRGGESASSPEGRS
jgi:hypothetical protein